MLALGGQAPQGGRQGAGVVGGGEDYSLRRSKQAIVAHGPSQGCAFLQ